MNIRYEGLSGEVYYVNEKRLAKGGEGSIHPIENCSELVAKIFKTERRTPEREKKLSLMVKTKLNEEQLKQITWPQDVIFDNDGFVGYVMPKLGKAVSLNEIYSNGTEQYDLQYRLLAAVNLCAAVQTVHEMGQVCGDLNPQNICINLDLNDRKNVCKVTLVDTDSYHFIAEGQTYRCEVGLADYIAPEVQKKMSGGMNLRNAPLPTYTKETDLFAVAVHVFTLLMNGCHPFACARDVNGKWENTMKQASSSTMDSVVAPQPIDNIKDGYFPFYEHRQGITHPLYAPSFESLPESLQRLFVQTFVEGYQNPSRRVGTEKWIQTLLELRGSEVQCRTNYRHYYFGNNAKCPLCTIEERMESIIVRPKPEPAPTPAPTPAPVPEPVIIPPVTEKTKGNKFLVGVLATICAALAIVLLVDKLDLFNNKTGTSKEMEAYDSIENSTKPPTMTPEMSEAPKTEPPTMTPEMSEAPKAAETTESKSDSESSKIKNEDEDYDEDADYGEDDMFIFPDSDSRFLKKSDLKGLTAYECRLARNEIYARCGRLFDDKKLQKYFDSCSWYDGYIEPEDFNEKKEFNKYEKANSKFILKYEREKRYR